MKISERTFRSDRRFVVFSYGVTHGLLLLRSGKTDRRGSRIDLLIRDVRALEIRSWFEGFEIAEGDKDDLIEFRSNPVQMIEPGNKIYILRGQAWEGFILGGTLSIHEDIEEFTAPSALITGTVYR
jgi:hypothetical protein